MNSYKKNFFIVLLIISFLLLFWTFYKDRIVFNGIESSYYINYYIISLILILFSILSLYLNDQIKEYLIILIVVVTGALYSIEGYLVYEKYELEKINKNRKTNLEIYEEIIDAESEANVSLAIYPTSHLSEKILFPLSGVSNSKTIFCSENGYHAIYESDRYGFNNPDEEWDKENIEFLLIGDSYTHGACVNRPNDIASVLRTLSNKSALNLGMYNNSSLIEYASLREYLKPNVKNVIWIYFGNDIGDLFWELNDEFLNKYLNDFNFTQNLKSRQNEINSYLNKWIEARLPTERKKFRLKKIKEKEKFLSILTFIEFIKMTELREYIFRNIDKIKSKENFKIKENIAKQGFIKILKSAKDLTIENNSNFYVVYLPGYIHYTKLDYKTHYEFVKKTTSELNIPLIDLHEEYFGKQDDPSIFSSFEAAHYNELGYEKAAEIIYKLTKN